jgi:hypothetical protein
MGTGNSYCTASTGTKNSSSMKRGKRLSTNMCLLLSTHYTSSTPSQRREAKISRMMKITRARCKR